jgi:hypothetical protein
MKLPQTKGGVMNRHRDRGRLRNCGVAALLTAFGSASGAQEPPPPVFAPQPDSAPPPVFAPQPAPASQPQFFDPNAQVQPGAPIESPKQTLKRMFAGTLATLTQTAGSVVLVGLTEAITGGLTSWFSRRRQKQADAAGVAAANAPAASTTPAFAPPPTFAPPPAFAPAPPPQFFDTQTGAATAPDPVFAQAFAAPAADNALFAGLAFEVHAVLPGGATAPVNPATHEFRTGDRFVVFYRPTLPGQMDVFNINPAGLQSHIDRVDLAAGQLAELGPYEFAALTGDEQLRLVLSPCSTPELLAATRDIVNVSAAAIAAPSFSLAGCSPQTRSVRELRTRDIRKVAVEGTTAFALDPVSATEFSSGQVTPREVTIRFRHL